VEKESDRPFLDAVAREYEKGRLLLVATVDLDARQAVLWNLTKVEEAVGRMHPNAQLPHRQVAPDVVLAEQPEVIVLGSHLLPHSASIAADGH
jgi:hypothetical protein